MGEAVYENFTGKYFAEKDGRVMTSFDVKIKHFFQENFLTKNHLFLHSGTELRKKTLIFFAAC